VRTTIDLSPELMQAAKVLAAQRGESLKELFSRAVAHELGAPPARHAGARLSLPLIGRTAEPTVEVTGADIEAALAEEDVARYAQ
jgi:hypothetical protein